MRYFKIGTLLLCACSSAKEVAVATQSEHESKALVAASQPVEDAESEPAHCVAARTGGDLPGSVRLASGSLRSLEFVRVRPLDPSRPASAWRMQVDSKRGPGTIVRFDGPAGECYLGRGVFQGWPQAALRHTYRRFSMAAPAFESFAQLG